MTQEKGKTASVGLGTILFLIFLTLKLANLGMVASWSWWWVTSPLWIPVAAVLVFLLAAAIVIAISSIFNK